MRCVNHIPMLPYYFIITKVEVSGGKYSNTKKKVKWRQKKI